MKNLTSNTHLSMLMIKLEVNFNFAMNFKREDVIGIHLHHTGKHPKDFPSCVCKRLYEPTQQVKIYNNVVLRKTVKHRYDQVVFLFHCMLSTMY